MSDNTIAMFWHDRLGLVAIQRVGTEVYSVVGRRVTQEDIEAPGFIDDVLRTLNGKPIPCPTCGEIEDLRPGTR
jgi:hypothetical protein